MTEKTDVDAASMSPLARLIRQKQSDGMSFRDMERNALRKGHSYSNSAFAQIARDERQTPLTTEACKAIAAGVEEDDWRLIAELDQERWGTRPAGQDAQDVLRFQRPAGLSDDEWDRLRRETRAFLEFQLDKAARER